MATRRPCFSLPLSGRLRRVHGCDVGCLQAFGALHEVELNGRSFGERAEPLSLNRGEVNENILAAFHADEAIALGIVEPLDCTGVAHVLMNLLMNSPLVACSNERPSLQDNFRASPPF